MSSTPASDLPDPEPRFGTAASPVTWAAAVLAVLGLAGSLYLSINLELKACPLCLHQRIFLMGVIGVLITGLMFRGVPGGLLCDLALPTAVGGLATAIVHVTLVARGVLECPHGIGGIGTAPQQSLVLFAILTLLLAIGAWQERIVTRSLCAAALGVLFAWGAFKSAPAAPMPTAPYAKDVDHDGCRPVFRPAEQSKS